MDNDNEVYKIPGFNNGKSDEKKGQIEFGGELEETCFAGFVNPPIVEEEEKEVSPIEFSEIIDSMSLADRGRIITVKCGKCEETITVFVPNE